MNATGKQFYILKNLIPLDKSSNTQKSKIFFIKENANKENTYT